MLPHSRLAGVAGVDVDEVAKAGLEILEDFDAFGELGADGAAAWGPGGDVSEGRAEEELAGDDAPCRFGADLGLAGEEGIGGVGGTKERRESSLSRREVCGVSYEVDGAK